MSQSDNQVKSRELLKPQFRTKYQTATFIYKALELAESQVEELLLEVEKLREENKVLKEESK